MLNKKSKSIIITALLIFIMSIALFILSGCGTRVACIFGQHTKDDGTVIKEATCVEKGRLEYNCTVCGVGLGSDDIDIIPHIKDEGTITKAATCTQEGEKVYHCTMCKIELVEEREVLSVIPHIKDEGTIKKAATCTQEGEKVYHCTMCKIELKEEREVLSILPHQYVIDENYWLLNSYKPANETRAAMIPCKCSVCKQDFVIEYTQETLSSMDNIIRIEDKYNTLTPLIFDSENQYLVINLAGADKALSELSDSGLYDLSAKILTLPVNFKAVALDKVKVVGFKTPVTSFAISTEVGNSLSITLQNLSYTAPQNTDGLNLNNLNNTTIEIVGLVSITAASEKDGIIAKNLNICGEGTLTVNGGNGINGTSKSGNGTNGGTGIQANKLTLSLNGETYVTGGDGGAAYNRPASDNGGEGYNGRDGYNGGNGGCGINATEITVDGGTYNIVGGNGGCGGNGSECNRSEWINTGSKNVVGGQGGDGGNGANAIKTNKIDIPSGSLSATGGNGGNSGKAGGCHDNSHKGFVFGWGDTTAEDGSCGTAGKGSEGISGTIDGDKTLITQTKGNNGSVNYDLNQNG